VQLSRKEFRAALLAEFPDLREDIEFWGESTHLETMELLIKTRDAISRGDLGRVRTHFAFLARKIHEF